jgi:cytidylate kinase
MTDKMTLDVSESLIRAHLHREAKDNGDTRTTSLSPKCTIAISRQTGARGSELARDVGNRLGWNVYDRELLEQIATDMHVRVNLLESVDERHVSWLEAFAESFVMGSKVSENAYATHLIETILGLAARGHCVIVGRGAAHLLPPSCTLRVRVVAPREARIETIAKQRGLTPRAAEHVIDQTEHQQRRFVLDHFHCDTTDDTRYDLVLNTSRWSMTECSEMVIDAMTRLRSHASERAMANLSRTERSPSMAAAVA